jgi:hypothetical protein
VFNISIAAFNFANQDEIVSDTNDLIDFVKLVFDKRAEASAYTSWFL